jgi:hypothetical protein
MQLACQRFWANRGEDRIARECQLLIDYLVKETGGQMYYTGRDMALSHQGMGITEADWTRFTGSWPDGRRRSDGFPEQPQGRHC